MIRESKTRKRLTFINSLFLFLYSCLIIPLQAQEVSPLTLVVPQRADITAKYIYAKHRSWGVKCQFGEQLYYRHLQLWNGFWEFDPPKRSFEDYLNAFNSLLDSVKSNGFNPSYPIPMGSGGVICNGAHRLTACLLYNKQISIEPCPWTCDYGFDFFRNCGLETKYLDAMALQYCELKPNSFIIVVFPSAGDHEKDVEEIVRKHALIVYQKTLFISTKGSVNLILTMYDQEDWVGTCENNFAGGRYKAQCCFPMESNEYQQIHVYLVESPHINSIKKCKAKIRLLFNNHHSIHSTDTHRDAIVLARTFFNQNSIDCINHREDHHFPLFESYFDEYKKKLASKESEWFCVDGGAVLAAYGLRDCQDIDVIHFKDSSFSFGSSVLQSHNSYLEYHTLPLDDILFNPDNYFFYRGIKFCSLQLVKEMKLRRGEPKDLLDVSLIDQMKFSETLRKSFEAIHQE